MADTNCTVVTRERVLFAAGPQTERYEISGLTSDVTASFAHQGPTALAVSSVRFYVKTRPTDNSIVHLESVGTDTTNNELDLRFGTQAGGSLDGAVLIVEATWDAAARQDGQSLTQNN